MRKKNRRLQGCFFLFLLVTTFGYCLPASASDVIHCLDCHGGFDPAAVNAPHSPFFWRFSRDNYEQGTHAGLDCKTCHIAKEADGFQYIPHNMERQAIPACIDCHKDFADIASQFMGSHHAVRFKNSFRCVHCHDPHNIQEQGKELPRLEHIAVLNHPCIDCHTTTERYQTVAGPNAVPADISHDWRPKTRHSMALPCICCHTPIDHVGIHEILAKEKAQRSCDACHNKRGAVVLKFVGEPDRSSWITHPILFDEVYVMGAMRHRLVDKLLIIFAGLTLIGIFTHGLLRVFTSFKRERGEPEIHDEYFYSRSLRLWHWTHAILFVILLITGIRLHFGGREGILISFETAFHVHNIIGAIEVVIGILFLVRNFYSDNAKSYFRLPSNMIGGMIKQVRYYLWGIFRGEPHPFHPARDRKFNPLQQIAYTGMMYILFPALLATGVVLLFSDMRPEQLFGKPGGWIFATVHYLVGAAFMFFLIVHLYLCTMGDRISYLIRGMITGYHRSNITKKEEDNRQSQNTEGMG